MKKAIITGLALSMFLASCEKEEINSNSSTSNTNNTVTEEVQESLEDQLKEFAPESENFTVNSESVITITTANGNLISFPANAFVDQEGNPVTGNVDIAITEIIGLQDLILSGSFTNSSEGILSTLGDFNISVEQNGVEVKLDDGTIFTISNPNLESNENITGLEFDQEANEGEGELIQNESSGNTECENYTNSVSEIYNAPASEIINRVNDSKDILSLRIAQNESYQFDLSEASYREWDGRRGISYHPDNQSWYIGDVFTIKAFGIGKNELELDENTNPWTLFSGIDSSFYVYSSGCNIDISHSTGSFQFDLDDQFVSIEFSGLNTRNNISELLKNSDLIQDCTLYENFKNVFNLNVIALFKEINGAVRFEYNEFGDFSAKQLPAGEDIEVLVYYTELDGTYKCGIQKIPAAQEMNFDSSLLNSFNTIDELFAEIKRLTK